MSFVLFCFDYLVFTTLFPLVCFHSKKLPAFRLFFVDECIIFQQTQHNSTQPNIIGGRRNGVSLFNNVSQLSSVDHPWTQNFAQVNN